MNPNPFASLNHFTVPVTIPTLLSMFGRHLAALSATTCGYENVTFEVVDLIPKAPPALPPAIQAGAIPPKVTGFAVQTPAVVPGDGIPWWDKDGLRSERAGKRHPAPSDVAPRSSRVRRPGAASARVRALAARCRAALVADAAGRAARVRQLAVQRALLVRGEPAAHQPRAPGRGRSSLPRRALGRAALSPRTRGLRGDALLADAAVAQCLRRARQADERSSALRSLLRRERRLAGGLRALRRDQAIPGRPPVAGMGAGAPLALAGCARSRPSRPARRDRPAPIRTVPLRRPLAGAARRVPPAGHRADRQPPHLRRPRQRRRPRPPGAVLPRPPRATHGRCRRP